jgi:hypothetical protein
MRGDIVKFASAGIDTDWIEDAERVPVAKDTLRDGRIKKSKLRVVNFL